MTETTALLTPKPLYIEVAELVRQRIYSRELEPGPLPECWRGAPDIDSNVEDTAAHATHQFGLRVGRGLEMESGRREE